MSNTASRETQNQGGSILTRLESAERIKNKRWDRFEQVRNFSSACRLFVALLSPIFVAGCGSFGPYHANTPDHPFNSVRGPKGSGRYQLAFVEFGDQGSNLDNSQIKAALDVIHQAERPFLFVYIHGLAKQRELTRRLPV